jgi:hypothetical protein
LSRNKSRVSRVFVRTVERLLDKQRESDPQYWRKSTNWFIEGSDPADSKNLKAPLDELKK